MIKKSSTYCRAAVYSPDDGIIRHFIDSYVIAMVICALPDHDGYSLDVRARLLSPPLPPQQGIMLGAMCLRASFLYAQHYYCADFRVRLPSSRGKHVRDVMVGFDVGCHPHCLLRRTQPDDPIPFYNNALVLRNLKPEAKGHHVQCMEAPLETLAQVGATFWRHCKGEGV